MEVSVKFLVLTFLFLCGVSANNEMWMMNVPQGIQLAPHQLDSNDVPGFLTYLMGFSSDLKTALKGVSVDMFQPPKANLMINVLVPDGVQFVFPRSDHVSYKIINSEFDKGFSMDETNEAIRKNYENSVILEDTGKQEGFSSSAPVLIENYRTSFSEKRQRLGESQLETMVKRLELKDDSDFLRVLVDMDMMMSVLQKLRENPDLTKDESPDSYVITVTSLLDLAVKYGDDSKLVEFAVDLLQGKISEFIEGMNELYGGKLLAEVVTSNELPRQFNVFSSRSRRDVTPEQDPNNTTNIVKGRVDPNHPDQVVIINIAVWTSVFIFLAVLAISYTTWYMDPGHDSVIYRMTDHRMKSD